ncbi:hypothetical protein TWF281_007827 [Arthrobotrys megalospora]
MARPSKNMLMAYSQAFILLILSYFINITNSQVTTFTTTTTTETWVVKDVTFSTVVAHLPWCPLPSPGTPVSASGPVVVQISFIANVTDGSVNAENDLITFLMNRNANDIVVSNDPLILSLNTDLVFQEFSNIPQTVYFSFPASFYAPSLRKRFDDFLPVSISDQLPDRAIFKGWFEDLQGEFFIRVQTSEGETILGFTVCPTDGTAAQGQKVYLYDLSLGVPNTSSCVKAAVNTLPYSLYTAGATSLPTGISIDGSTTSTSTRSSRTSRRTSSTRRTNTQSTITSGGASTGIDTTSSTSGTSSTTSFTSPTAGGSSTSSSSDTRPHTTTTYWTTGVPDGTISTTAETAGATVTVSEYRPYPSSIKIVSTKLGDTSAAMYYIKAIFMPNFFVQVPDSYHQVGVPYGWEYNLIWVLDEDGRLFIPISGPLIKDSVWNGLGRNTTRLYTVASKPTAADVTSFDGMILKTKSWDEMLDTDVLLSFNVTSSGLLTLNSAVNTTSGYGIWACEESGQHWGLTDGTNSACNWDEITEMQMQGFQTIVDSDVEFYGLITSAGSYTAGLGDGPTATRHPIVPKSFTTVTTEVSTGSYFLETNGGGLTVPTATVTFNQYVKYETSTDYWNITVSVSSTLVGGATEPTKTVLEYLAPTGAPMFRMFWTGGQTSSRKYLRLDFDGTGPEDLYLYGDENTDPSSQNPSLFWVPEGSTNLIERVFNANIPGSRLGWPRTAYWSSSSQSISFDPDYDNVGRQFKELMVWNLDRTASTIFPALPTGVPSTGALAGDPAIWMCGKGTGTTYPSGPNFIKLSGSGNTAAQVIPSDPQAATNCGIIESTSFGVEFGTWENGDFWKRDRDGVYRNDNGLAYHDSVATASTENIWDSIAKETSSSS